MYWKCYLEFLLMVNTQQAAKVSFERLPGQIEGLGVV